LCRPFSSQWDTGQHEPPQAPAQDVDPQAPGVGQHVRGSSGFAGSTNVSLDV
jgi:hypothetical protein